MVYYGLRRRKPSLHFIMISPINETTCGGDEGVLTTPEEFGLIYTDIAKHLIKDRLDESPSSVRTIAGAGQIVIMPW